MLDTASDRAGIYTGHSGRPHTVLLSWACLKVLHGSHAHATACTRPLTSAKQSHESQPLPQK
jgi:hypothetical protein